MLRIAPFLFPIFLAAGAQAAALPAGVMQGASVEGITEYTLANGLKVLLFPDATNPTTTVNVTYLVVSRQESYGETGMAHLLEHLLFKGTPSIANIFQELGRRGMRMNGSTFFDRTNYFETFTTSDESLDWAPAMEADRMVNSFVAKKDLDTEMTVVRNEFERWENSPQQVLWGRLQAAAFDWHNYSNLTIGARSDIQQVQSGLVRRIGKLYEQQGQPQRIATIDQDATIIESHKAAAYAHYEEGRGYQPMVAVWAEADLAVADEFRDGNVPAKQDPLGCAKLAFAALPETVTRRYFRGDSACHENELLDWLKHPDREQEPGGRIGFAVSAVMSPPLGEALRKIAEGGWKTFGKEDDGTLRQWAEVDFVPGEKSEHKEPGEARRPRRAGPAHVRAGALAVVRQPEHLARERGARPQRRADPRRGQHPRRGRLGPGLEDAAQTGATVLQGHQKHRSGPILADP